METTMNIKEKKYKFIKIRRLDMSADTPAYWMLLIDTAYRLEKYLEVYGEHIGMEYLDLRKNREYMDKKGIDGHYRNREQLVMHHTIADEKEKMKNGEREYLPRHIMGTFVSDIVLIEEKFISPKVKCFIEDGSIMVNHNNGWHPGKNYIKNRFYEGPMYEIVDIIEKDEYIYPDEKIQNIKISQWVEGKHWYAQAYGCTVEVNGRIKWDTQKEAMEAVTKYIEEHKEIIK
jgi:hypothetical protein